MHLCVPGAHRSQTRVLGNPLELELETVVSLFMGAGNRVQVLWESSKCSYHGATRLSGPHPLGFGFSVRLT